MTQEPMDGIHYQQASRRPWGTAARRGVTCGAAAPDADALLWNVLPLLLLLAVP